MFHRFQVDVANTQSRHPVDDDWLIEVSEHVLAAEEVAAATISLAIVDNETIHRLNAEFLGHDYPTDVLSFLLECESSHSEVAGMIPRGRGKRIQGEVIASADMAMQQAAKLGGAFRDELLLYVVHGLLHLIGYDDLTEAERQIMRRRESELLLKWNVRVAPVDTEQGGSQSATIRAESSRLSGEEN